LLFLLISVFCGTFAINAIQKSHPKVEKKMQSAMEKSVGKNETYYTASTGHPFALGTAPDHINSHRQPWNTWKHWFQRVPESKWNRAKTTINHQKLSEKCLLTSLFTAAQILNPSHGH